MVNRDKQESKNITKSNAEKSITKHFIKKVILLTGMPGSGKSIISSLARELGYTVYNMGDIVREEAEKRGINITSESLLKLARQLRDKKGEDIVAKIICNKIKKSKKSDFILIDGVRSLPELLYFKKKLKNNCVLIAIHSSPSTRFQRIKRRGRADDPKIWDEFVKKDLKELKLGIGSVIALADIMIINEESLESFKKFIKNFLKRLKNGN